MIVILGSEDDYMDAFVVKRSLLVGINPQHLAVLRSSVGFLLLDKWLTLTGPRFVAISITSLLCGQEIVRLRLPNF